MTSGITTETAKRTLAQTEEELFRSLGLFLVEASGADSMDDEDFVKKGRKWLTYELPEIRKIICNGKISKHLQSQEDMTQLLISVADVLAALFTGVALITISALVVKIGLKKICNSTSL